MSSASNTLLSLIIIGLGFLGITLSFLVPDRKKSLISLVLAGVMILTGLIQLGTQSLSQYSMNRRIREIQRENQANMEQLREKMKTQTPPAAPAAQKK